MFNEQELQAPHVVQDPSTGMADILFAFQVTLKIVYNFVMLTVAISRISWRCGTRYISAKALCPHSCV